MDASDTYSSSKPSTWILKATAVMALFFLWGCNDGGVSCRISDNPPFGVPACGSGRVYCPELIDCSGGAPVAGESTTCRDDDVAILYLSGASGCDDPVCLSDDQYAEFCN